jgi:hypothetical protein
MSDSKQQIRAALTRLIEGHHIPGGYGGRADLPGTDNAAMGPFGYLQACLETTFLAFLDHPRYATFWLHALRQTATGRQFAILPPARVLGDATARAATPELTAAIVSGATVGIRVHDEGPDYLVLSPPTGDAQVYAITSAGAALLAPTDKDRVGVVRLVESEVERMLAMLPAPLRLGAEGEGEAIGWEYGTPPGLSAAEWPRHEKTGMPLAHGFTVRVPAAYRVKGQDFVALSFFHPADSEACYGENERALAVMSGAPLADDEQDDPYFLALVRHLEARENPSAERIIQTFADMLGHTHALVWHTEASAAAPHCERPGEEPPEGIDPEAFVQADEPASPLFATTGRSEIHFGRPLHPMQSHGALNEMGLFVLELKTGAGGVNFGDGTGQIDLESGVLDWAC